MVLFESFLSAIKTCLKFPRSQLELYVIKLDCPLKYSTFIWPVLTFKSATPHFSHTAARSATEDQHLLLRLSYHCIIIYGSYRDSCCQCQDNGPPHPNPVPRSIAATGTTVGLLIGGEVRYSGIFRCLNYKQYFRFCSAFGEGVIKGAKQNVGRRTRILILRKTKL